jgi:hypothetical protein
MPETAICSMLTFFFQKPTRFRHPTCVKNHKAISMAHDANNTYLRSCAMPGCYFRLDFTTSGMLFTSVPHRSPFQPCYTVCGSAVFLPAG